MFVYILRLVYNALLKTFPPIFVCISVYIYKKMCEYMRVSISV